MSFCGHWTTPTCSATIWDPDETMKRFLTILGLLLLVAPLAAEPSADEALANRRRFEQVRKQPEQLEKLRRDAAAYFGLPEQRRLQILHMHESLHQEPTATQTRLHGVLDRYVDWLNDLDEPTRQKIAAAPNKQARVELIRKLREEQWIKEQPKAIRDQVAKLEGDARKKLIAKEKDDDRQRRLEWLIASRFWNELEGEAKGRRFLPRKFTDLPQGVQLYVQNYLQKIYLSPEESEQLKKLEGQWPQFPMKLVELADKHPPALPGTVGPRSMAEVPAKVFRDLLNKTPNPKRFLKEPPANQPAALAKALNITKNTWPEFGIELARAARQHSVVFDYEFLAYNYECLTKPMQDFMDKLEKVLDAKETLRLSKAKDKGWPEFPQTIQDLANAHHLSVPWFTLPRVENWENYRLVRHDR